MDMPGEPGHVHRQRAGIGQVHLHRVVHLRAERPGSLRRCRGDQGVVPRLPKQVEVALDERPDLLGLHVERVVVAGGQCVRAEHDPALDLGPEAAAARREVVGEVVLPAAHGVAEPDAVVARQVRRRLGRGDDVVRREAVVRVREAHLLDGRARRLERRSRITDPRLHLRLHAGDEVLAGQAEPLPPQVRRRLVVRGWQRDEVGRDRDRRRRGVPRIPSRHGVEQSGRITDVPPERPHLVQRGGERHDPVPADPPVGWLDADNAGVGRRLPDRPAGVRPDRDGHLVRRHCRRRAARRSPRHAIERPRVRRRPVARVLRGRAHRELVHVRLAQDHRAGLAQALGDVRVVRGAVALEDAGAGGALAALDRDEVLETDRDPQQRMQRIDRGRPIGARGGKAGVGGVGIGQGTLVVEREPGVEAVVRAGGRARGARRSSRGLTPRRSAGGRPARGPGGS